MVVVHVIKAFRDILERADREPGDEFPATESRAKQIDQRLPGYITYESAPEDEGADLAVLSLKELKSLADERGITYPRNAGKEKLIGLLEGE